jgi:hypothetical protein
MFFLRPQGNATSVEPNGGFSDPGLKKLFHPNPSSSTVTSTNPKISGTATAAGTSPSGSMAGALSSINKKHRSGAIAGGVVGGLLAIAALLGLVIVLLRRLKQKHVQEQRGLEELEATYKDHPILDSRPLYEKSGISALISEMGDSHSESDSNMPPTKTPSQDPAEMEGSEVPAPMPHAVPSPPGTDHNDGVPSEMEKDSEGGVPAERGKTSPKG